MAPKKVGKKKDEVVDLPKASTLPDGTKEYYVGGWSSSNVLADVSLIAEEVRPKKEEEEAAVGVTSISLLPGDIGTAGTTESVTVSHRMVIAGLTAQVAATATSAFETARRSAAAAGGEGGDEGAAAAAAEGEAAAEEEGAGSVAAAPTRKVLVLDSSVRVLSDIVLVGVRPTVTVAPAVVEVKAAVPTKGKKVTEEEKQREAEDRRLREEAALQAAKDEEAHLNQFAMPRRWASVNIERVNFVGRVVVSQAHITFRNCVFSSASVEVNQYARVQFLDCLFAQPSANALYAFPLSEIVVKGCVFSGLAPPATQEAATADFATASIAEERRNTSVGVHADGSKISIEDTSFELLGTGVLLRGRFEGAAPTVAASTEGEAAKATKPVPSKTQVVQQCTFTRSFVTAILLDGASNVSLKKNTVTASDYYGLSMVNGGKNQLVHGNTFTSKVYIGAGTFPTLHSNLLDGPLVDANNGGNVYMQPKY